MSKKLSIVPAATSATAVAFAPVVNLNNAGTPFQPGFNLLLCINTKGMTGAPVIKFQQSVDAAFTTPVDLYATSGITRDNWVEEVTPTLPFVRGGPTTGAGAGTFEMFLLGGGAP